ncbi:hypothetical protein ABBQ38_005492 [Trebouxia sp. C0009 RCD-2024]
MATPLDVAHEQASHSGARVELYVSHSPLADPPAGPHLTGSRVMTLPPWYDLPPPSPFTLRAPEDAAFNSKSPCGRLRSSRFLTLTSLSDSCVLAQNAHATAGMLAPAAKSRRLRHTSRATSHNLRHCTGSKRSGHGQNQAADFPRAPRLTHQPSPGTQGCLRC